jgi:hypothetical protein
LFWLKKNAKPRLLFATELDIPAHLAEKLVDKKMVCILTGKWILDDIILMWIRAHATKVKFKKHRTDERSVIHRLYWKWLGILGVVFCR